MKNIQLNKQGWQIAQVVLQRWTRQLPHSILITYGRGVKFILLLLAFGVALYVVLRLLYLTPGEAQPSERSAIRLQVDTVDELELWLEERQEERERTIISGQRRYFAEP